MRLRARVASFSAVLGLVLATSSVSVPQAGADQTTTDYTAGFETDSAESAAVMNNWWANSQLYSYGIYVWGRERDTQSNLTASWVSSLTTTGWSFMPLALDAQAPCTSWAVKISSNTASATAGGQWVAQQSEAAMTGLGLKTGILYYDLEPWDATNAGCTAAVDAFIKGWVNQLHVDGWWAGVYANPCGNNSDPINWTKFGAFVPDDVWFADNTPTDPNPADESGCIASTYWSLHQRIKQYIVDNPSSPHLETHGSYTLETDDDCIDARIQDPSGVTHSGGCADPR